MIAGVIVGAVTAFAAILILALALRRYVVGKYDDSGTADDLLPPFAKDKCVKTFGNQELANSALLRTQLDCESKTTRTHQP
jgi:hypothetical protein